MKHLARLLRSGAIMPQTYAEGLSALAETQRTPAPHQRHEPPIPAPRQRRERPTPLGASEGPSRARATCRRLRWTSTSTRSFQKCRANGSSRPRAGEDLSRPRATWCFAGLAGSSTHSCEDGRWMCTKGTPTVQTPMSS